MNTASHTSPVELLQQPQPSSYRSYNLGLHIPGQKRMQINLYDKVTTPTVLRQLVESPAFRAEGTRIPLALGQQENAPFLIPDLTNLRHLLVAGQHEEEVGAALRNLQLSLLLRQREEKVEISFMNCRDEGADLPTFLRQLQEAAREATSRLLFFDMAGVEGMDTFNTRSPETLRYPGAARFLPERMARRVIVLNQPGELLRHNREETLHALIRLCKATSRSRFAPRDAGIHLIITCNSPTRESLPSELLKHLPARLIFRTASKKRLLPGAPPAQQRLRPGVFRYRAHEQDNCHTATLPLSSEAELQAVLQYSARHTP